MTDGALHETADSLATETVDLHRAIRSLMEELEAIDWYQQRIDATSDRELRAVLIHNRDEEKEHAAMVLEWLRRRDAVFDRQLQAYLFTEGPLREREDDGDRHEAVEPAAARRSTIADLGIGDLRPRTTAGER